MPSSIESIALGSYTSYAIDDAGVVWAWGRNHEMSLRRAGSIFDTAAREGGRKVIVMRVLRTACLARGKMWARMPHITMCQRSTLRSPCPVTPFRLQVVSTSCSVQSSKLSQIGFQR